MKQYIYGTVRALLGIILGMIVYVPMAMGIPYLLAFVIKILSFILFFGTRYTMPPAFDFEYALQDFKMFILTVCLGTIISGLLSGVLTGIVAPTTKKAGIMSIVLSVPFLIFITDIAIDWWNSEHWFYSACMEITFFITFLAYLIALYFILLHKLESSNSD